MKVAGVDAGKKGSCALLDTDDPASLTFYDIPLDDDRDLDARAFFDRLLEFSPDVLVTEFTWKPVTLVRMTGEICAVAKVLQAHLEVVQVAKWKTAVIGRNTDDKDASIARCLELFPHADLVKPRARTLSPDRAEAACLAAYWTISTQPRKPSK